MPLYRTSPAIYTWFTRFFFKSYAFDHIPQGCVKGKWGNHTITPVSAKPRWRIWVNGSHDSTENWWYNQFNDIRNKTLYKYMRCNVYIFCKRRGNCHTRFTNHGVIFESVSRSCNLNIIGVWQIYKWPNCFVSNNFPLLVSALISGSRLLPISLTVCLDACQAGISSDRAQKTIKRSTVLPCRCSYESECGSNDCNYRKGPLNKIEKLPWKWKECDVIANVCDKYCLQLSK